MSEGGERRSVDTSMVAALGPIPKRAKGYYGDRVNKASSWHSVNSMIVSAAISENAKPERRPSVDPSIYLF